MISSTHSVRPGLSVGLGDHMGVGGLRVLGVLRAGPGPSGALGARGGARRAQLP